MNNLAAGNVRERPVAGTERRQGATRNSRERRQTADRYDKTRDVRVDNATFKLTPRRGRNTRHASNVTLRWSLGQWLIDAPAKIRYRILAYSSKFPRVSMKRSERRRCYPSFPIFIPPLFPFTHFFSRSFFYPDFFVSRGFLRQRVQPDEIESRAL